MHRFLFPWRRAPTGLWESSLCKKYGLPRRAASSQVKSYTPQYGWRLPVFACVFTAVCVVANCATNQSLTRTGRALMAMVRMIYMYKVMTPETAEEWSDLHRSAASVLLNVCLQNEGLYIKLGQSLVALNHVLPWEYTDTLKVLLDRAPAVPINDIRQVIVEETGKTCEELFVHFDPNPVATASIAQVHKALIQPSNPQLAPLEVCVKVQKPYIRHQMFWDLQTYRFVLRVLGTVFNLPVSWVKETVVEGMQREVDFSIEARNAIRIRHDLAGRKDVYVPEVYGDLVTPRLLVMEWTDGVKLVDVAAVRRQFDEVNIFRILFSVFGDMIFKHGFVHCDPHGANILVRPQPTDLRRFVRGNRKCYNPQIVLLDFGLCCPESERFRVEYALLLKAIILRDTLTVGKVFNSWGIDSEKPLSNIQLCKPYHSFSRGRRREMTREEAMRWHKEQHGRIRNVLKREEQLPLELSLVSRSIDILHGVSGLYGGPVNRVGIFARRAVSALGSISSYEDAQLYLGQLVDVGMIPSLFSGKPPSLFDPLLEQQRRDEVVAVACLQRKRSDAPLRIVWDRLLSAYLQIQLELFLSFLDVFHTFTRWCIVST